MRVPRSICHFESMLEKQHAVSSVLCLQMLCVVLVSLEVAAHESHDPRVSAALLHLHLGYATAVAVLAVVSKGCQLVSAASAEDYRWGWLAVLSLISVLLGAVFAVDQLFPTTSHAHVRALAPFGLWLQKVPLPFGFASWEGAWHVALASGAVFVVSTFCLRNLTRSTPLLAPLVSDVTVRFVSSTPKVALTFNGSIEGEVGDSHMLSPTLCCIRSVLKSINAPVVLFVMLACPRKCDVHSTPTAPLVVSVCCCSTWRHCCNCWMR